MEGAPGVEKGPTTSSILRLSIHSLWSIDETVTGIVGVLNSRMSRRLWLR